MECLKLRATHDCRDQHPRSHPIPTATFHVFVKTSTQACPKLEEIGGLSSWGGVELEELDMMQQEVRARNLKLTLR